MTRLRIFLFVKSFFITIAILDGAFAFRFSATSSLAHSLQRSASSIAERHSLTALHVFKTKEETESATSTVGGVTQPSPSVEETTEKYGLEAGLFQSLQSDDKGESAKSLLAKYGVAYLATSIPLALISFLLCYYLVDNGVDVGALLAKIGINAGDTGEKAGTFAIAYAAHKAASPIRFPPTVLLTPVVAKVIGKEPNMDGEGVDND